MASASSRRTQESAQEHLRAAHRFEMLSARSPHIALVNRAAAQAAERVILGAAEPAGTASEVAVKLAALVRELAGDVADEEGRPTQIIPFLLASCALSDLVLIGDRPIHLQQTDGA